MVQYMPCPFCLSVVPFGDKAHCCQSTDVLQREVEACIGSHRIGPEAPPPQPLTAPPPPPWSLEKHWK